MSELVLIHPLLLSAPDRRALSGHFARGRVTTTGASCWRTWLAARIGRSDLAEVAPASLAAQGAADAWFATPVQLLAGLDRVHMATDGWLELEQIEARTLQSDFARQFTGTPLALEYCDAEGFLLRGLNAADAETSDPVQAFGRDIAPFLPRGHQGAAVRRLATEIEMWLHGHAVNAMRARSRRPAISALWIWGGGRSAAVPAIRAPVGRAHGRDAWLRALWRAQGSEVTSEEWRLDAQGPATGAREDTYWIWRGRELGPALESMRRALALGHYDRLRVVTGERHVLLGRGDAWKRWRRPLDAEAW